MKRQGLRKPGMPSVVAGIVAALVLAAVSPARSAQDVIPFNRVELFIEFNSTDNDAGIQVFLDGEAWEKVRIISPEGQTIFEVAAKRNLKKIGLTELRFESDEPSLEEILAKFPPGAYKFVGETVEGAKLKGVATLSHEIPDAPAILSPPSGGQVDPNNAVISWVAVSGIASYQVIVEQEALGVMMTVDVSASTTSLKVPPEFLQPGTEYKFEVLAISTNGNKTITESTFVTSP